MHWKMPLFVAPTGWRDGDDGKTVEQVRAQLVGRIGENIRVRRFHRLELGA
jgi:translation elongation factor EF-Ts